MPAPDGDLGSATGSVPVAVRAQGLLAGNDVPRAGRGEQRARARCMGRIILFTTQPAAARSRCPMAGSGKWSHRPIKEGAIIDPIGELGAGGGLIQASADGSAITYIATGPMGSNVAGNPSPIGATQVLSRRGAGGWSSKTSRSPSITRAETIYANISSSRPIFRGRSSNPTAIRCYSAGSDRTDAVRARQQRRQLCAAGDREQRAAGNQFGS